MKKSAELFKIKKHVKHKKIFQTIMLRRVGTGWEANNGHIKLFGPNRVELLELMDQWESITREALRASKLGTPVVKAKSSAKKKKTTKRKA